MVTLVSIVLLGIALALALLIYRSSRLEAWISCREGRPGSWWRDLGLVSWISLTLEI